MPIRLTSPRLALDPAADGDVPALHALLIQPGVRRYLCDDQVLETDEVAALVAHARSLAGRGLGLWVLRRDDAAIGCAALLPVSAAVAAAWPGFAGEVEPTVALAETAWGRGYAGEALAAMLTHGFAGLGLTRIVGVADEPNLRSRRMLERAGFRFLARCPGPAHTLHLYRAAAPSGARR
jgi:ribosomal-protein-alanine N-acetyltransferase